MLFGSVASVKFTVVSATRIIAVAPAQAAGTVDVTVMTPGGTSAVGKADRYTYVAAPVVTAIAPQSGATRGGTVVAVSGSGFSGASRVLFGSVPTGFTVVSSTRIIALAPPHAAGAVDVTVSTPFGASAAGNADRYTYVAPAPVVLAVSPAYGSVKGGTEVAIVGAGFSGASAVGFGSVPAVSLVVKSDDLIIAIAPAHSAGTVAITVTTRSGTSPVGNADRFTYSSQRYLHELISVPGQ